MKAKHGLIDPCCCCKGRIVGGEDYEPVQVHRVAANRKVTTVTKYVHAHCAPLQRENFQRWEEKHLAPRKQSAQAAE